MKEEEILAGIKQYFCIEELVSPVVYKIWGEKAWQFIDMRLLHTVLVIRRGLGVGMNANNWKWGGKFKQRGLRTTIGYKYYKYITKSKLYLSAHVMGKAIDFDAKGMTADQVRDWIIENEDILPYKVRLERKVLKTGKTITWVHLDVFWYEDNPKVCLFDI